MNLLKYLGNLSRSDPLYAYFCSDILPLFGVKRDAPDFTAYMIAGSKNVYLYESKEIRILGKFFGSERGRSNRSAQRHMEQEFNNLNHLRSLGFSGYPHYVPRPLGRNANLNFVLVEEFCYGTPLDAVISRSIRHGAPDLLFRKLTSLAFFLSSLHNRTVMDRQVEFWRECSYYDKIIEELRMDRLGEKEAQELYIIKEHWRERPEMWEDRQVLVHGDMTPSNVLFGDGLWVIALDLERLKAADRVFDLGRVTGELKHFFLQKTGDGMLAEPFIGHFLWEYSSHFPDTRGMFSSITLRNPFYMGLNLFRIARNSWLPRDYRARLVKEAIEILR